MRAALLYGKEDIRVENVELPRTAEHEILLKVKRAFICGTDVRMFKNGLGHISNGSPLVPGHEISGVIEKIGEAVSGFELGWKVTVAPNMGCGKCEQCASGNTQLCSKYRALGIHINGGFAEYVRIPAAAVQQGNVIRIPDNVSFEEAALVEPLSCVFNAFERSHIQPGDTVLIIGAGPIGIMHAKLAKLGGATKIIINDLEQNRLDLCRRTDSSFITLDGNNVRDNVMKITNNKGVNVCITACPSPQAQILALDITGINGRVVFFGGLPEDKAKVLLNTNLIHYKQLVVTGTARSSLRQFRKTLELISSGSIIVKDLVTATFDIDHIGEAIEAASCGFGLKNAIDFEKTTAPSHIIGVRAKKTSTKVQTSKL